MMHKKNSNRWMMIKAVFLPTLMALAVVAFAKPKVEDNLLETQNEIPTGQKDDNKIYDVVDVNASFPDGIEACYKWIKDQIKYPEDCKTQGISGRVMTQFTVNKDGSLSNIKALQSPHASLSKEAIRVVNAMPKWKPAKVKGKVVRSYFRLPINFRLHDTEKKVTVIQGKPSGEVTVIGPTGQVIDNTVFSNPETRAEFPGGEEAMYKWIADHLKYPEECKAKNIQGRVTAQFVVNIDGSITEIKVIKSPDELLSQEAIRVISAMPKWKPATSDGKNPVKSHWRIPLNFRLPPAKTEQKR